MTNAEVVLAVRRGQRALRAAHEAARRRPHGDIAMAVIVWFVTLVTTAAAMSPDSNGPDLLSVSVAGVACGVLVARRRWPLPVLLTSTVAAEVYLAPQAGHAGLLVVSAPLIALYSVVESTARRRSLVIGGLAVLALAGIHIALKPSSPIGVENLALAALGGLAVAAGDAARNRREYLAEVEERVRRAEEGREREARRRVTDERLRIARDLHDVVGHQLALINVQAAVAAHVLDERPAQARESLGHIRRATREALEELRDTIALLRDADQQLAPVEPTVGLAALPDLLASFERSGLRVDSQATGERTALPPAVDLTAYRVVQESLTNVCKHADAGSAQLSLRYEPTALDIVVDNDGPPPPPSFEGAGHGIVGMRERVVALGGTLQAGPRDGGFRVLARLPVHWDGAA